MGLTIEFMRKYDSGVIAGFLADWPAWNTSTDVVSQHDRKLHDYVVEFKSSAVTVLVSWLQMSATCLSLRDRDYYLETLQWRLTHAVARLMYTPYRQRDVPTVLSGQMTLFDSHPVQPSVHGEQARASGEEPRSIMRLDTGCDPRSDPWAKRSSATRKIVQSRENIQVRGCIYGDQPPRPPVKIKRELSVYGTSQ
jgi:hypothetical protein